jgi:phosphoribosylaminoimidazole-succinocarboxamide synthase
MTEDFISMVSERYIELFENITGNKFVKEPAETLEKRIETNITKWLNNSK